MKEIVIIEPQTKEDITLLLGICKRIRAFAFTVDDEEDFDDEVQFIDVDGEVKDDSDE